MQMKEPLIAESAVIEPADRDSRVHAFNESMSILEICDRSDGEECRDRVKLVKARSMILEDNAQLDSPYTKRGLFT